jgi:hypothetical protein
VLKKRSRDLLWKGLGVFRIAILEDFLDPPSDFIEIAGSGGR